jgi:hypothetical protein
MNRSKLFIVISYMYVQELCPLRARDQLSLIQHFAIQDIVVAEMYAAIEVSQYIIGSGSCAVSQFMALNIGARRRVGRLIQKLSVTFILRLTTLSGFPQNQAL